MSSGLNVVEELKSKKKKPHGGQKGNQNARKYIKIEGIDFDLASEEGVIDTLNYIVKTALEKGQISVATTALKLKMESMGLISRSVMNVRKEKTESKGEEEMATYIKNLPTDIQNAILVHEQRKEKSK